MEAKFFSEIEKKINVKTIKDFEKEIRIKINNEFETLRKKNEDLSRILIADECNMWNKIKNGAYSWLQLNNDKNKKLYRLIEIYSNFNEIVDSVKNLNTKIDRVKLLKNAPDGSKIRKKIIFIKYYIYPPKYAFIKSLLSSSKCGLCITSRILVPRCLSNR